MVDDNKRREVAARLREVEILEYDGDEWCDEGDVLDALGVYNADDPSSCDPDKVAFLADLIDSPTARVDVNEHGRAYCTNCGCVDWCLSEGSPYCPNCGREVVE